MRRYIKDMRSPNKALRMLLTGRGDVPSSILEKHPFLGDMEWIIESKGLLLPITRDEFPVVEEWLSTCLDVGIKNKDHPKCRWGYDSMDNEDVLLYIDFSCTYCELLLSLVTHQILKNRIEGVYDEPL